MLRIKPEFDYISRGPASGTARKLVVLLHGYGVNARFMEKLADELVRAIPDALVICPHAPDVMALPEADKHEELDVPPPDEAKNPPAGLTPDMQREWFPIANSATEMHGSLLQVAEKMNAFIDARRDELGLEDKDVALMGFSQGGALALYTAFTRDGEISCVVGHSTFVMHTNDFKTKPPALLVYGTADQSFSEDYYQRRGVRPLQAYLQDFEAKVVKGLKHTTNAVSRKIVTDYIKKKLDDPKP